MRTLRISAGFAVVSLAALLLPATSDAAVPASPRAKRAVTVISCIMNGSGRFADTTDGSLGLTDLTQRSVSVNASSSGNCLDLRSDKSATGGHTIKQRSVSVTGTLADATCVLASGTLTVSATWTLDDGSTLPSTNSMTISAGNFLEEVPGSGTVSSGLFDGATMENNTVFDNPIANAAACASSTGLTSHTYTTEVNIIQ